MQQHTDAMPAYKACDEMLEMHLTAQLSCRCRLSKWGKGRGLIGGKPACEPVTAVKMGEEESEKEPRGSGWVIRCLQPYLAS